MSHAFVFLRDCEAAIMDALECCDNMAINPHSMEAKAHLINALSHIQILQGRK